MILVNLFAILIAPKWPSYISTWLHTASINANVTFTLVTDLDVADLPPTHAQLIGENIKFVKTTLKDLNERVNYSLDLNFTVSIPHGYKFCDYKPMYGKIFEDLAEGFTHWGWIDIDVIYGDLLYGISSNYGDEDIYSYSHKWTVTPGQLLVLKNTPKMVNLYKQLGYHQLSWGLQSEKNKYISLDEVHFSRLVESSPDVTTRLMFHKCEGSWFWFDGRLFRRWGKKKQCILAHFGGGGTAKSNRAKSHIIKMLSAFYEQRLYKRNYGFYHISEFDARGIYTDTFLYFLIRRNENISQSISTNNVILEDQNNVFNATTMAAIKSTFIELLRRVESQFPNALMSSS